MEIKRSSKCSLKFLTGKKREELLEVMEEYSRVVNFFIDIFWLNNFRNKDLMREIFLMVGKVMLAKTLSNIDDVDHLHL